MEVFERNGYRKQQGLKAFQRASKERRIKNARDEQVSKVQLSFIHGTIDKIAHILKKNHVFATFKNLNTIRNSLRFVKDWVNPKDMKGIYSIPCSCGIPYIGETSHSINKKNQEHVADTKHNCSLSSAIVEHVEKTKHHVCIENSKAIARIDHFHHRKLSEAIYIEKHVVNLNGDDGWKLSRSWIHALSY